MRGLAKSVGSKGVTANCIALSAMRTPATEPALADPDMARKILRNYVIKRLGEPSDASALALEELGDELLSAFAVFGDAATVKARIADFRAAGLAAPILYPIIPRDPDRSADDVLAATIEVLTLCRDA
jgi:NAD(P)-dependent dehydrogenase (short-subunit alcohol dehydrogenase family)